MFDDFFSEAEALRTDQKPFAVALVVRCDRPVSGKPGDKAIIQPDGRTWGWVGGGCVQALVHREALKALKDGTPRLMCITPSRQLESEPGAVYYNMTCQGGGALEIYIEPVLPTPLILIVGRSLVAQTLSKLGKTVGYRIAAIASGIEPDKFPDADFIYKELRLEDVPITDETYVVVSTQGEHDEEALEQALSLNVPYISFVASQAKAAKVLAFVAGKGIPTETISRIKAPAGLDLGHLSPEEIAVSILAEIIQFRKRGPSPFSDRIEAVAASEQQPDEIIDPVCGMVIDPANAEYTSEYEGTTYYFCCAGCKQAFDRSSGVQKFKSAETKKSKEEEH
jgi:xanthine dehydrogenase accessory factor